MNVSNPPLTLSKADAARRQAEAAIIAFEQGHFDIAITLAGAAEGMLSHQKGEDLYSVMIDHPKAKEHFNKKDWNSILNLERDWLKHPTLELPDTWEFGARDASFMIARALSKLDSWSPKMDEFKEWYLRNLGLR
ncbi:hypothetical protein KHP60_04495 [Microvirga sp. 3-52]|uniref:hypothetical protein n=1 Tax=Microvirga sp. 3-52 TaxID=2792425 RepID=UPI001AD12D28|nr:hypothetical protein [Microvirga sp. 3-52]MBO1903992.1 hypothetical protein [Microvirga sp. 3-52]MBS7451605.1 hypothetical protein [Microvirga sp. 3-52]